MAFKGNTQEVTNQSQLSNQSGNQSSNQTGTSAGSQTGSQNATQVGQTTPWDATNGILSNLLAQLGGTSSSLNPTQTGAIDRLSAVGGAGSPFAPQIGGVANTLLAGGGPDRTGMVNDAYSQYKAALQPFASGSFVDPSSNPALQKYLDVARNDASTAVNSQFAGAGRDLSGLNQQAVSRGITQAEAPILYDAYNQGRAGQRSAIDSLYGAGGQTAGLLSGFDQTRLGNMTAGVGTAGAANDANSYGPLLQLQAESMRTGIPLDTLARQFGLTLPAAQAFGRQTGTSAGSSAATSSENTSNLLSSLYSGNSSGTGTSTKETNVPLFDKLLSAAATGAAIYGKASDIRLKRDIKRVGKLDNGLPVYSYRYAGSPVYEIGLMAQDVEKVMPEAVGERGGFKFVDYAMATGGH